MTGCPRCGARLAGDAAWCSHCLYVVDPAWRPRSRFRPRAAPVQAVAATDDPYGWGSHHVPSRQRRPERRHVSIGPKGAMIAVLLVLVALALVMGWFLVMRVVDIMGAMFNAG